jgi:hypothetical protein
VSEHHETDGTVENVTEDVFEANKKRWDAERERAVAVHGEEKVAAAEDRWDEITDWKKRGPKSAADRAWMYRAKKAGLLTSQFFEKEDPEPGVTWASYRKWAKRSNHREYIRDLLTKAQAGDKEAEAKLRDQLDIRDFNRLVDYYKRFVSAFDRATDENRRLLAINFPNTMDDLSCIWNWLRHETGRTDENVTK